MTSQCTKRWLASFIFERKLQCICWRKLPDLEASGMICTINLKQHCVKQRIGSLLFFMVCLFVCLLCLFVCLFVWSFSGSVVGNPLSGFFVLLYLFALVCLTFVCMFVCFLFWSFSGSVVGNPLCRSARFLPELPSLKMFTPLVLSEEAGFIEIEKMTRGARDDLTKTDENRSIQDRPCVL